MHILKVKQNVRVLINNLAIITNNFKRIERERERARVNIVWLSWFQLVKLMHRNGNSAKWETTAVRERERERERIDESEA